MTQRTARVSAAVLLVHAGLIWLALHRLAAPVVLGSGEQVIVASVVTQMPAPAARPSPAPVARPLTTPAPQPQRAATTPAPLTSAVSATTQAETPAGATPAMSASPASAGSASASLRPAPAASTATAALVLPSSDADYLNNPPPAYPRMSRRMGEQGTVLVRVFINAEGRAEKAEIRTSSGHPRLDEAALDTVQRWRYVPGKRAGLPEAMWFNVPIRFVLD